MAKGTEKRYATPEVEAWKHRVKLFGLIEELEAEDETFRPLRDLRDMVLPHAKEVLKGIATYDDINEWWMYFYEVFVNSDLIINLTPCSQALLQWEKKWNFPLWARGQVLSTLAHWSTYPDIVGRNPLRWDGFVVPLMSEEDMLYATDLLDFGFLVDKGDSDDNEGEDVDAIYYAAQIRRETFFKLLADLKYNDDSELDWYPLFESRKHVKQRIMSLLEKAVDIYLDKIESQCESLGLKPETKKYQKGERHYRWFARYVFHGWTYEKIADEENVPDSDTIRKAVTDLGKLMNTPVERNTHFESHSKKA
ncbi:hypothetical protein GCM10010885_10390 [Alicyclobacillus cellulosilyticus]|uniref:Uncharacterized protein n=1 Tax=Alicyclobacillus cellulosilyticus TaxID=1003997 RepID=A0A917K9S7_9BACL|nr:hypothetical protein [Alicyclobacillus cellulosilyticus]GGJ03031.1 hypothetical protein GCM10010885_10390 [Alicyclobacillus cellulosilyticus]